jgi:ABC-2 family transporter protein
MSSPTAATGRTGLLLVRRFLADYARNPVNLLMLVLVPVVFVAVAGGAIADIAKLFGGPGGPAVQDATAGWAAGFIAALAAYFQMRASRAADRRLVLAGLAPSRLAAARAVTGLLLALLASAAAVAALAARAGIGDPGRVLAGTVMFAVIYLAIGAVTGALVESPVNGAVVIFFVWILDVMLGPSFGTAARPFTRVFPAHFVTLWITGVPSHHSGRIGDLGWALAWTIGAAAVAWVVLAAATRVAGTHRHAPPGSAASQLTAGLRIGLRNISRNRVLWVLLAGVPVVYVALAAATTPDNNIAIALREHGHLVTRQYWFPDIHPGVMAPIAIATLATLAGLFIVLDARAADRRLALAGFRAGTLLATRLLEITLAALLATATSVAIAAAFFHPRQWAVYAAANILTSLTYALIGVILGPLFGRVAGVFIAFLIPFLDLAIAQDPMLYTQPPAWAHALPGYGAFRVLLDGALSGTFGETRSLLIALAWLAGLLAAATVVFRRTMRTGGSSARLAAPGR